MSLTWRQRTKLDPQAIAEDVVDATVRFTGTKLEVIGAKVDRTRRDIVRAVWMAGGLATFAGVLSCAVGISVRAPSLVGFGHSSCSVPEHQRFVNVAADAAEETARTPRSMVLAKNPLGGLAAGTNALGEKTPPEQWIPKQPFANQKLAPNCRLALGEEAINGGCWVALKNVRPPCGDELYRHGDTCYRPVAADPNTPVGGTGTALK